jgi:hypothetical protein
MATLPAFLKRNGLPGIDLPQSMPAARSAVKYAAPAAVRRRNPNQLRALPQENVFFYCKKIDNSRLVREADPRSTTTCWSAIGAACVVMALSTGVLVPQLMGTLAGYKLEALRSEQRRLADERHNLEWKEAELLNMNRLEKLAKDQNLTAPTPGQVVRLNGKDSSVAMNQPQ